MSIDEYAFYQCTSLTSVTIPGSTGIGNHAFAYCSGLTSVTIENGVKTIRDRTFFQCTSLTSITIPDTVTSIGEYAFFYNPLTNVNYDGTIAAWRAINKSVDYKKGVPNGCIVHCTDGDVNF